MTGAVLAYDVALGGDRIGSTQDIRRTLRLRRLRSIGAGHRPPESGPVNTALQVDAGNGNCWLGRAWRALAQGDYPVAAYAAGMARGHEDPAQSALILARAYAGLQRLDDAIVEAQRALRLAPGEPEHHLTLAGIYEDLGNWEAALHYYQATERLAPGCPAARAGRASVASQTGDTGGAQRILEAVYATNPDRQAVGDCLSLVLIEAAEQIPRVRVGDTYVITSAKEISAMRAKLTRAAAVTQDPDLLACVNKVRAYVDTCAHREWLSHRLLRSRIGLTYLAALATLGIGMAAVPLLADQPFVILIAALILVCRVSYDLLRYLRVPRWKLNHWACARDLDS